MPIANTDYQTYIDQLIQRAKKYGNYVLILKAGQFPDAPCGANGQNCSAPNQGDLNCAASGSSTSAVCLAQDTSGTYIDTAFTFWAAFAQKYAGDPAVLYDTWEDMHGIDNGTWSNGQNGFDRHAIRTYAPQSLIFMEDTGNTANTGAPFESIVSGALPDVVWANLVWNFHLYTQSTGSCVEPNSARYANWPQNVSPLVDLSRTRMGTAAHHRGGAAATTPERHHTNITSFAQTNGLALVYFDNTFGLIGASKLTAIGTKVAQAYTAIAAGVRHW